MYRPQFSFPPEPDGTYDEDFVYSFDPTNTPALDIRFPPAQTTLRIPLQMQSDASFIHRGLKMNTVLPSFLGVQLFFPDDSPLSDDVLPLDSFSANGDNSVPILEPEMPAPAGASYQVSVVNRSSSQSALPLSADINPVLVDPVGLGIGPVVQNNVPTTSTYGPFLFNGALFMFLVPTAGGETVIQAFRSLDAGATWQHVGTVGEPGNNAMPVFDGNHTVIVAFSTSPVGTNGSINFQNFDLSTLTWGAPYGTAGAPTTQAVYGTYIRPDASIIVLHNPRAGGAGTGSGLFAAVFAAGAWVTNFDAGAAIATLPGYVLADDLTETSTAVLDPAGNLHVFFSTLGDTPGPPNWLGRVFYQQIHLDNSLGTFFDFPGNDTVPTKIVSGTTLGSANALIIGNSVVMGITQLDLVSSVQFQNVVIGTPLSAPVFSYAPEPGMDQGAFNNDITPFQPPYMFYDGRTIFAVSIFNTEGLIGNEFHIEFNNAPATPGVGWGAVEFWNWATDARFNNPAIVSQFFLRPSLQVVGDTLYLSAEGAPTNSGRARYYLGTITIEPIRIQFRGVKRYVRGARVQNCAK